MPTPSPTTRLLDANYQHSDESPLKQAAETLAQDIRDAIDTHNNSRRFCCFLRRNPTPEMIELLSKVKEIEDAKHGSPQEKALRLLALVHYKMGPKTTSYQIVSRIRDDGSIGDEHDYDESDAKDADQQDQERAQNGILRNIVKSPTYKQLRAFMQENAESKRLHRDYYHGYSRSAGNSRNSSPARQVASVSPARSLTA